jgi:transcriptional regulator with XRE-family HTH domain
VSTEIRSVLGKNIARLRRAAKLSGEDLASRAGSGLTRSIIANLENGRKGDVTTAQLLAISVALGVSPAELLFDLADPYQLVDVARYEDTDVTAPAWVAYGWFNGAFFTPEMTNAVADNTVPLVVNPASQHDLFLLVQERYYLLAEEGRLAEEEAGLDRGDWTKDATRNQQVDTKLTQTRARLYALERSLKAGGVDLDRPANGPGVPF